MVVALPVGGQVERARCYWRGRFPPGGGITRAIIGGRASASGGRLVDEWLNDVLLAMPDFSSTGEAQRARYRGAYHYTRGN
jgi:hypothetical protein